MQMRNAIAEHVHVYLVRRGSRSHGVGGSRQNRPQRRRLRPVEVGDEGNMAVGFEVSESHYGTVKHDREAPVLVLPDPAAAKVRVRITDAAQQAVVVGHLPSIASHPRSTLIEFPTKQGDRGVGLNGTRDEALRCNEKTRTPV